MYALDNKSGIKQMPEIPEVFSKNPLWFTEGRDGNSPSYPGAHWFNIVQAELLNVLKEAGIEPEKADLTQLAQAFRKFNATFDSIAALREFKPLRDRQVVFVKSYYAGSNKGGGYFIADFTDTATTDNGGTVIVTARGKKWKRVYDIIRPSDFGILGDGSDETLAIKKMLDFATETGTKIIWTQGQYTLSDYEYVGTTPKVHWESEGKVELISNKTSPRSNSWDDDYFIKVHTNASTTSRKVLGNFYDGGTAINLESTEGINDGDVLLLCTSKMIPTDHRGQARYGICVTAEKVLSDTKVQLSEALPFSCKIGETEGRITNVNNNYQWTVEMNESVSVSDMRYRLEMTSGSATGKTAFIVDYDVDTQIMSSHTVNARLPAGVQVGDTFKIVRDATIFVRDQNASFEINGDFAFSRAPTYNAQAGDLGYRGLWISGFKHPRIIGLNTQHFTECGIKIDWCYRALVKNGHHLGCSRAYNISDGTGYGVSFVQCSFGVAESISGHNCRRTLDFGGTQGISFFNRAVNVSGTGGGIYLYGREILSCG